MPLFCTSALAKDRVTSRQGMPGQVTKSCHICQAQHIIAACQHCGASFCEADARASFPEWSRARMMRKCPRCEDVCTCRQCLRKVFPNAPPEYSDKVRQAMTDLALAQMLPVMLEVVQLEDAEAQWDMQEAYGKPASRPPAFGNMDSIAATHINGEQGLNKLGHNGNRVLCNACGTAISDLHYNCKECGWDACARCMKEDRIKRLAAHRWTGRRCPNPMCYIGGGGEMKPWRLVDGHWRHALRAMYTYCELRDLHLTNTTEALMLRFTQLPQR
ncbi:hypothetical protein DUNSADRAFT_13712 [Dunaliella salina]|uniref:Uncharacterized protein n=1 Tax=Dunaliella salina TaxID=3046 RepID=A0ABQ7H327_DUNSA|nr:hypothetical protein DUNSADRAFT_13712 [Dunaliella salina]|eukprot:KAF5841259.1 hypothetical protein DUNSADRAFT_13712 [Dunaliella salina]